MMMGEDGELDAPPPHPEPRGGVGACQARSRKEGRNVGEMSEESKVEERRPKVTVETAARELARDFGCRVIIDDPEYRGFSVTPEGRLTPLKEEGKR